MDRIDTAEDGQFERIQWKISHIYTHAHKQANVHDVCDGECPPSVTVFIVRASRSIYCVYELSSTLGTTNKFITFTTDFYASGRV